MWSSELRGAACQACQNTFLIPAGEDDVLCPHCYQIALDRVANVAEEGPSPELVVPFSLDSQEAVKHIAAFVMSIPIAPDDLTSENLTTRMQRVYLPIWLTDAHVEAQWKAEVGFHYAVMSHQERYKGGIWQSEEKEETRTRWEPRVGTLARHYENIESAAVHAFKAYGRHLGDWDLSAAQPYQPDAVAGSIVQRPMRSPDDAWREARSGFRNAVVREILEASGADDIRGFSWGPTFEERNWTQLLVPLYTTYYLNDDGEREVLFVHGQTGKTYGKLKASLRAARFRILVAVVAALLIFAGSMVLLVMGVIFLPLLGLFALVGLAAAVGFLILAAMPLIVVSQFNKKQHEPLPWLQP